jgi:regulator of sigma E protease
MSQKKGSFGKWFHGIFWLAVLGVITYLIVRNLAAFGNVLRVLLGFGAVVLVHEFGHFIVGKLSGIKVEAFSIFMPPTIIGLKKTENGLRIRVLPGLFRKEPDKSSEALLSFTLGGKSKPADTEYRIGMIPFGGFVKMLGQDDIGPVKKCDDPRSFANKPALTRVAVITAGVVFNAISAIIIFMIVFFVGIQLLPPVVGGLEPNSPAAVAGLRPGDEVIEIAGKSKGLDFANIGLAAALSGNEEAVPLKVRHEDGSVEDFAIVPRQTDTPTGKMRLFGVLQPETLTIAPVKDPNTLLERTGLLPWDRITAVNGAEVRTHWGMLSVVAEILDPAVKLSATRTEGPEKGAVVEPNIPLDWKFADHYEVAYESELYHAYSMVPRLRITYITSLAAAGSRASGPAGVKDKLLGLFGKTAADPEDIDAAPALKAGDIILKIADVNYPTYVDIRRLAPQYEDRDLRITVLRADPNGSERTLSVTVKPKRPPGADRVLIGIAVALDAEHPVVANTIQTESGPQKLDIPRGAAITAVDGVPVFSFYDVVRQIKKYPGQRIAIDYRLDENIAGAVALDVAARPESVTVKSELAEYIPFDIMTRIYKANGPFDAVVMGYRKTLGFITQTYVTLRRLISGLVSPKSLMGPVGIITLSYQIAKEQPFIYYVYFLGLISAVIGVFNFLPLPPLDGGLVVLLIIEKIKGSPLSERVQGAIIYAGWALIGSLILYVTFNDIVRSFFS